VERSHCTGKKIVHLQRKKGKGREFSNDGRNRESQLGRGAPLSIIYWKRVRKNQSGLKAEKGSRLSGGEKKSPRNYIYVIVRKGVSCVEWTRKRSRRGTPDNKRNERTSSCFSGGGEEK